MHSGPNKTHAFPKDLGFPVGMATLAYEEGIDVAYHVAQFLHRAGNKVGLSLSLFPFLFMTLFFTHSLTHTH